MKEVLAADDYGWRKSPFPLRTWFLGVEVAHTLPDSSTLWLIWKSLIGLRMLAITTNKGRHEVGWDTRWRLLREFGGME